MALPPAAPLPAPLSAQQTKPDEGFSLMEERARMLPRGLMDEMGPGFAKEVRPQLRAFSDQFCPALAGLEWMIDEIGNYQASEILPNGDPIIRRRKGDQPYEPPEDATPRDDVEH